MPTFQALPAVRDGRSFVVDSDMWLGTVPFAVHWVLDDLEALLGGEGAGGIGARWAESEADL